MNTETLTLETITLDAVRDTQPPTYSRSWVLVPIGSMLLVLVALLGWLYSINDLHYYHGGGQRGISVGQECGANVNVEWGQGSIALSYDICD